MAYEGHGYWRGAELAAPADMADTIATQRSSLRHSPAALPPSTGTFAVLIIKSVFSSFRMVSVVAGCHPSYLTSHLPHITLSCLPSLVFTAPLHTPQRTHYVLIESRSLRCGAPSSLKEGRSAAVNEGRSIALLKSPKLMTPSLSARDEDS